MIRLICGPKGTGKTKIIFEQLDNAVSEAKGDIVLITKKKIETLRVNFRVRCLDTDAFGIDGLDAMRGFIKGLMAGNADIEYIFIDGLLKIIGDDKAAVESFISDVATLEKEYGFKAIMTVSMDAADLPEGVKGYAA